MGRCQLLDQLFGALCGEIDAALPGRLISGLGGIDSAPPSIDSGIVDKWKLDVIAGEFDAGVKAWNQLEILTLVKVSRYFITLAEHGREAPEWDAASETWEIKPESALAAIDAIRL